MTLSRKRVNPPALSARCSSVSVVFQLLVVLVVFLLVFWDRTSEMETQYSELELALNTLVTEFHKAADNGPTMNTTQFQSMISSQMPAIAKTVENEEGLGKVLEQMGVQSGQNISFDNFWKLINNHALQLFGTMHKEKGTKCTCLLQ